MIYSFSSNGDWIISGRVNFLSYEDLHAAFPDISVEHFKKKYEEYLDASNRSSGVLAAQNKVLMSVLWNDAVGKVNNAVFASKIMCDWFGVDYRRVEKFMVAKQDPTKKHGMVAYRVDHPPHNATLDKV